MATPARDLIVNLVGKTNQLMTPLQGASAQLSSVGSTLTRTLTPAAAALGVGMGLAVASSTRAPTRCGSAPGRPATRCRR